VVVISVTEGTTRCSSTRTCSRSPTWSSSKTDLLPHVDFDVDRLAADSASLHRGSAFTSLSAKTGDGLADGTGWLTQMGEGSMEVPKNMRRGLDLTAPWALGQHTRSLPVVATQRQGAPQAGRLMFSGPPWIPPHLGGQPYHQQAVTRLRRKECEHADPRMEVTRVRGQPVDVEVRRGAGGRSC